MYKIDSATELKAPAFHVSETGVYAESPRGPIRICSRLEIRASARSQQNDDWSQLLCFRDPDGHEHQCLIPMAMLAADGNEYRARLLKEGLEIEPGRVVRKLLHTYIQTANPPTRIRCVKNVGWHQDAFVRRTKPSGRPVTNQSGSKDRPQSHISCAFPAQSRGGAR